MVGTIWHSSRSWISRSLEGSRHLPWLDKLRANLPGLLSESAEIRLHCTPTTSLSLPLPPFYFLSALAGAFKYLRNRWQFCCGVMAREARSTCGSIFENKRRKLEREAELRKVGKKVNEGEERNESREGVRKRRKVQTQSKKKWDFRRGFEKLNFATRLLVILAGSQDFRNVGFIARYKFSRWAAVM